MKKNKLNYISSFIWSSILFTAWNTRGYKVLNLDVNQTVAFYDQSVSSYNAFFTVRFTKKLCNSQCLNNSAKLKQSTSGWSNDDIMTFSFVIRGANRWLKIIAIIN